jgi:hypothetical protein
MILTKKSKARKVSKNSFEVLLPEAGKTYVML